MPLSQAIYGLGIPVIGLRLGIGGCHTGSGSSPGRDDPPDPGSNPGRGARFLSSNMKRVHSSARSQNTAGEVERRAFNPLVEGSNPPAPATSL